MISSISAKVKARASVRLLAMLVGTVLGTAYPALAAAQAAADESWTRVVTSDGSAAAPRHEASAVAVGGKLYLMGGRGDRPVQIYDPASNRWNDTTPLPTELHHFQPVAVGSDIYVVGAFTCCYPDEVTVPSIYRFDTLASTWTVVDEMPLARRRGSTAAVARDGWIYIIGGNTNGHRAGAVAWFDRYNPSTGAWEILDDAPHARDHFLAAIAGDTLVAASGRMTEQPNPFANPVLATDRYDFGSGTWSVGNPIPSGRAGAITVADGDEVLIAGGEIDTSGPSLASVLSYSVRNNRWRNLQSMNDGRHSGGGAVLGNRFHVVAGSRNRGGAPETDSHESLLLDSGADADDDGLIDRDETDRYQTDPNNPDTDADSLLDGIEVTIGTNPLLSDTDADTLSDGAEVNEFGTNPTLGDTDADGLDDAREVGLTKTDPLLADTDADGLSDSVELERGTDPLLADSDQDGLDDLDEQTVTNTDPLLFDTDGDGLGDGDEVDVHKTSPNLADTDDDGLDDQAEISVHKTDPVKPDTDGDSLLDGVEVNEHGTSPLLADTDGDTLTDAEELLRGSDPLLAETDEGGVDVDDDNPVEAPKKGGGGGASSGFALLMLVLIMWRRRSVKTLAT